MSAKPVPRDLECGGCGVRGPWMFDRCTICGCYFCGECENPAAHKYECEREMAALAPCERCGWPGCTPDYCGPRDEEREGLQEFAEWSAAWVAGKVSA